MYESVSICKVGEAVDREFRDMTRLAEIEAPARGIPSVNVRAIIDIEDCCITEFGAERDRHLIWSRTESSQQQSLDGVFVYTGLYRLSVILRRV